MLTNSIPVAPPPLTPPRKGEGKRPPHRHPLPLPHPDAFAERARFDRRPETMAAFPDAGAFGPADASWRKSAIRLYRNWLDIVAERKAALLEEAPIAVARLGG